MRTVIQRVSEASVTVDGLVSGIIKNGLLILVGIEEIDTKEDIEWLTNKIANLRIFNDQNGVMNCSVIDTDGEILVVSQFTLHASTKKGNRPSYIKAANPQYANMMYEMFVTSLASKISHPIQTGVFGADMKVALLNDGPVTIIMDSQRRE